MGGYNNGVDDRPHSSLADGEDNDAAAGNDQGYTTAADVDSGNTEVGTSSIVLASSNTLNQNNNADTGDANAEDASGRKTLVRNTTVAGDDGGDADAGTLSLVLVVRWWWRWQWRWQWRFGIDGHPSRA